MMKQLAVAAALALAAQGAQAETPMEVKNAGVPGLAEGMRSVKLTAVVTAVDAKARTVTLKAKDGTVETLAVGPQVKRFDEIAVGDTLAVEYEEALALAEKAGLGQGKPRKLTKPGPVDVLAEGFQRQLERLSALNDPRGVYTRMPMDLELR